MNTGWIETYTGKRVTPANMSEKDLDIEDIAHSLALQCRFTGHCKKFYSIAEHSVRVAGVVTKLLLEDKLRKATDPTSVSVPSDVFIASDYTTILGGLLHDAHEAYTGDLATPLKDARRKEIEDTIQGKVVNRFGLAGVDSSVISRADKIMLATEAVYLMKDVEGWELEEQPLDVKYEPSKVFTPAEWSRAEEMFLARFKELVARRQSAKMGG